MYHNNKVPKHAYSPYASEQLHHAYPAHYFFYTCYKTVINTNINNHFRDINRQNAIILPQYSQVMLHDHLQSFKGSAPLFHP